MRWWRSRVASKRCCGPIRYCERSEAIQLSIRCSLDCFVASLLAMTESTRNSNMTDKPSPRRPHPRHCRRRRDRRPPEGHRRGSRPLDLLEAALQRAEQDSGAKLLGAVHSLDIVNFLSWRYHDPDKQLSQRLGIAPAIAITARSAARARSAIFTRRRAHRARRMQVAAVCGAEAQSTATKADRAGVKLPWTPFAHNVPRSRSAARRSRSRSP